jgi:hypothetical protein
MVKNSILANNTGGNCSTSNAFITDGGHNFDDGTTCPFTGTGCANTSGSSFCNTNPLLDPAGLGNNGGPTLTIALQDGSPAIDAVPIAQCPSTDQRGGARPDPGDSGVTACDSGAVESGDVVPTTTTSTTTSTTTTTLFLCDSIPASGCQPPAAVGKAQLLLGNGKLSWNWTNTIFTASDFGSPPTTTNYLLCLYGNAGETLSAQAPAGRMCGTKPCWKALGTVGFTYGDQAGTPDGLTKVLLNTGHRILRGKIGVQGGGANLHLPMLPLTTPVRVQLRRSGSSVCWEATYSTATTNTASEFKAKSD